MHVQWYLLWQLNYAKVSEFLTKIIMRALNVNVSKTSAFFKTSYFVIIVLWQGRKISSMYRGTKQNCCKYLRLLPSRILIGSTCIIHSLVHWSFGDFWFIEKKEEKDEYVFNSNRYFALSHCRMPNSINNSLESINLHDILSRRIPYHCIS